METKPVTWSHSALKDYESCARKYHEVRVLKKYPREETPQTLYGTQLHEQAELFIRDGRPLDPAFKFLQKTLDKLVLMPGTKLPEYEMALTNGLQVCDFKSKDAWVRGIADLVILDEKNYTARVFDYKSGSDKYPDTGQLELMALMVMKHFPKVRRVTAGLLFVLKDTAAKCSVDREDEHKLWWNYRERVARIEKSHFHNIWNPSQSGLCKKHCPVLDCAYNGRN